MEVPYSRIFILNGTQNVTEDVIKDAFKPFGNVRAVKKILDRHTQTDRKGLAYVRYSKASEAFLAVEKMDGKMLPGAPGILKVVIAQDKHSPESGNQKPIHRIMVKIPKDWNKDKVKETFEEFGTVTDVHIPRKWDSQGTEEHKGFAFVEFERAYHAAVAIEECDSGFKPFFALPKGVKHSGGDNKQGGFKRSHESSFNNPQSGASGGGGGNYGGNFRQGGNFGHGGGNYQSGGGNYNAPPPSNFQQSGPPSSSNDYRTGPPGFGKEGKTNLEIKPAGQITQELLYSLFDIVPGMTGLEPSRNGPFYNVKYESPNWADYARQKFNGLQLPSCRLEVYFPIDGTGANPLANVIQQLATAATVQNPLELQNLLANLQQQAASLTTSTSQMQGGMMNQGQASSFNQQQGNSYNQSTNTYGNQSNSYNQGMGSNNYNQGQGNASGSWGNNDYNQSNQQHYCNFTLPDKKPPASGSPSVKIFIYSKDGELPEWVTNDLFCRFDGFHSVHWPSGKNYGFAQYTSEAEGQTVIDTLHGKVVANSMLTLRFCDMNPKPKADQSDDFEMKDEDDFDAKRPRY